MSDIAIKVENISKCYRIGLKEDNRDSLVNTIVSWIKSPISNFIRLRKLSKFGEYENSDDIIWALKDVSFDVRDGEILGIIGRNGAGKSTLLKILSRITDPTSGRAFVNGHVASLLEVGTGFHPELTGRENVYLNGTILGMSKREINKKFDEIVEFSGLEKFIDTPTKRYSSGMIVRLGFSVAAHLEPEILLVDEVLAVGDIEFQKKCLGKMKEVTHLGRTVLFVSHNMHAISRLCPKALLLESGHIKKIGNTLDVINTYLEFSSTGKGEHVWRWSDAEIDRLTFVPIALRVLDSEGIPASRVRSDKAFCIEIDYRLTEKVINIFIILCLYTSQGELIFQSLDRDNTSVRDLYVRKSNSYRARCEVPSNLLNNGQYILGLTVIVKGAEVLFHQPQILVFDVDFMGESDLFAGGVRSGILRPSLNWTTEEKKL